MRLSDVWFTALSENESGQMITVYGRDELNEFTESGKFKERVEITWKYEGDGRGLPSDDLGEKMEAVEEALRKAMEKKDKLAILTGVYTGGGEKVWVFYTRTVRVFGERLNEALAPFELLPISIYTEMDPDWEEYKDMYEMKEWGWIEILCFEFGVKGIFLIEIPSFSRHGSLAIKANESKRGARTSCHHRFLTR